LILGGFTSIPGAIVGGLIIGIGEKIGETLLGWSMVGGGIESVARLHDRTRLPAVPAARACSAKRSSRGCRGSSDVLPRSWPVQDDLRGRSGDPAAASKIASVMMLSILLIAICRSPGLLVNDFILAIDHGPVPDVLALATIGLNVLTGFCRAAVSGHRRVHGRRSLCLPTS
jgi:hypothetical protein